MTRLQPLQQLSDCRDRRAMPVARAWWGMACLIGLCALGGCASKPKPAYPAATIHGAVKIDGAPVKEGSIQFLPAPGVKGQVVSGTIVEGKYTAANVPVGSLRAIFNITRATGKMIKEYSTPYPEVENLVPEKYRGGIELAVSGDGEHNFELTSK